MSSAVVYGEVTSPNIADDSDPICKHWMPYARAKAAAEVFLRNVLSSSPVEIALLRPGIVWGPRSPHTLGIVESLLQKRAFLGFAVMIATISVGSLTSLILSN
jgi:nucleoside-diphosphate-sugar epimerase